MNYKALDDPALLMPRVMDVYGTFQRMGFVWSKCRGDAEQCVRNVQLFHPVASERVRRAISHVRFLVLYRNGTVDVNASYGYPTRRRNSRKIVSGFKELTDRDYRDFSVDNDIALRSVEKTLKILIHNLEHCQLDFRGIDDDGNPHPMPGHEALSCAVRSGLANSAKHVVRDHGEWFEIDQWWISEEPPEERSKPARTLRSGGRLPNFDNRKQLRGLVRRQH